MEKLNKVYGIIGIKAEMANWNADFNGDPKNTPDGLIFASDKALKWAIRNQWRQNGEKVLMTKRQTFDSKGNVVTATLEQSYNKLFDTKLDPKKNDVILNNLFSALDIANFGVAFAVSKCNHSITGAVQIQQGINKFEDTNIIVQDILSPFVNSNSVKEDGTQNAKASIGKMTIVDKAHYCYGFTVNPNNYMDYKELLGDNFEGYTEEAYNKFKEAALTCATNIESCSKTGCSNEYAIFINLKQGSNKALPNLQQFVTIEEEDNKTFVNINKMQNLLKMDAIENIEIFYDDNMTEIIYDELNTDIINKITFKSIY